MSVDSIAVRGEGPILALGRLAIAVLYIPAGYGHLTGLVGFSHYLATKGLPGPAIAWAIMAAIFEFFGSLALLVGFKTRYAALALIAFTIIAAFLGHPYWATADAGAARNQFIHFWKDVAIVGGLLFVFVRGAGPLSIDRR